MLLLVAMQALEHTLIYSFEGSQRHLNEPIITVADCLMYVT